MATSRNRASRFQWEGYAVDEVLKALRPDKAYYWATHQGAEIDLLNSRTPNQ